MVQIYTIYLTNKTFLGIIIKINAYMKYNVSANDIQIVDSYLISKNDFDDVLTELNSLYPEHNVLIHRKYNSLKYEWAVHNLFYNLGILRCRTASVDFNYPIRQIESIVYSVLGKLALFLIR